MAKTPKHAASGSRADQGQNVAIDRATAAILDEWCDDNRAVKKAVLSGIVAWWVAQHSAVMRGVALGKYDPEFAGRYASALEAMAKVARSQAVAEGEPRGTRRGPNGKFPPPAGGDAP